MKPKSFEIAGAELSAYAALLAFPDDVRAFVKLGRATLIPKMERITAKYLSGEFPIVFVSDGVYDERPVSSREILFGKNFEREGIPAFDPKKSFYGVTKDGTVYFRSPSIMLYSYLWELFLAEFAPLGSVPAGVYREIPDFDLASLEKEGYKQVFADDFDGDVFDHDVWELRNPGARRVGFQAESQIRTVDGNLEISGSYEEDGEYGPGWYGAIMQLKQPYCRGYFETRMKCSHSLGRAGGDFWSAFWIQGPSPYDPAQSKGGIGPGGCEIDIMENWGPDYFSCCFWVAGVEGVDGLSGELSEISDGGNDYVNDFHTYALLWDEDNYRVYLDGMLVSVTPHAYGTSRVPEKVLISLEVPDNISIDRSVRRVMYVDYLKIWQK